MPYEHYFDMIRAKNRAYIQEKRYRLNRERQQYRKDVLDMIGLTGLFFASIGVLYFILAVGGTYR